MSFGVTLPRLSGGLTDVRVGEALSGEVRGWAMVDIRLMQAAVAVAEELSFSRAAIKLGITQSALTKQIQDLEERVARELFRRNKQHVEVTEEGEAFVEEARKSLLHAERAVNSARARSGSAEAVLRIGRSPYTDPFLVSTVLSVRLPFYPQLRVSLSSNFSGALANEVLTGSLNLALVSGPMAPPGLSSTRLATTSLYVALSSDDPLAESQQLRLKDLNGRQWVLFERHVNPAMYDRLHKTAATENAVPTDSQHVTSAEEALTFISGGSGIALLTRSGAWRIARDGITMRPLTDESLVLNTYLAAHPEDDSRLVSEFVRSVARKLEVLTKPVQERLPLAG